MIINQKSFHKYLYDRLKGNIEPALILMFSQLGKMQEYAKNDILYAKDRTPLHIGYLERGSAIALIYSKTSRQVLRIWRAGELICPHGFFTNLSLPYAIIALEDSLVREIDYKQVHRFLMNFPEGYSLMNKIIEMEIELVERNIHNYSKNISIQNHEAFLQALEISLPGNN